MRPEDLLGHLRNRGIELSIRGDKLHLDAPAGALTPDLRATLATWKAELISLLRRPIQDADEHRYTVPEGWSVKSWVERLRYMARICVNADRAAELQAWADGLKQEGERHGNQARAPPMGVLARQKVVRPRNINGKNALE